MVLSRFWLTIFIASLLFVGYEVISGNIYSVDSLLNGKKDDPVQLSELYLDHLPKALQDSLVVAPEKTITIDRDTLNPDTTYVYANKTVRVFSGKQKSDGLLPTCKSSLFDLILPLMAYLAFFCGLMQLLIQSGAAEKLARWLSPVFVHVFPTVPKNHPSISYMTLNFAANFLGLDSAATPFGLKAMESLQTINPDKEKASDAQIMFMCLHAAGLTLIPTSIIGYRAAENAQNPADVMLPCIVTSFIGTLAALLIVGIRQRIRFGSAVLLLSIFSIVGLIAGLFWYISGLDFIEKNVFTSNLSGILLLGIILLTLVFSWKQEKRFTAAQTTIFDSFVEGAREGLQTGVKIFPYVLGMLVAISFFRNSGLFEYISQGIAIGFSQIGVSKEITDSLPVALLRPFSSGGSRGFMIDAMRQLGPDSLSGRLSCIFQCSAETTFYVIAVYFGSVQIKNTRYTLSTMLLVDFICVLAAIGVACWFF
ncbi:MAG: spore maturation protein [Flavobacterium sp. BFFFF2]|nr:MAG: spore maturation protein [Flavobacterium sp. BFFFF2]